MLLKHLGECLDYPRKEIDGDLISKFGDNDLMKQFFAKVGDMPLSQQQEHYVQTFDVSPLCSLYLSIHLFGEESFKRSELMAGLKAAYARESAEESSELPDHLSVIFKKSHCFSDEEWSELVSLAILPALPVIIKQLEGTASPYSLVLQAANEILKGGMVRV